MSTPSRYFSADHPERLALLEAAARSWVGTPFRANTRIKGAGVSCHLVVVAILVECGAIVERDWPLGSPWHCHAQRSELMVPQIAELPEFRLVVDQGPQPGDMLGFRLGGAVHHLALALGNGLIVHAVRHYGVCLDTLADSTWSGRLEKVWEVVR